MPTNRHAAQQSANRSRLAPESHERWYWITGLSLGFLFLSFRLLYFMEMDQAIHEYIGWRLTKGELPYIGGFDQNLPGGDILHALSILLFGTSSLGFALFDLLVQTLALYLIIKVLREIGAPKLAFFLGPLFYAWIYIGLDAWHSGQRDAFAVPLLLLTLLLTLRLADDIRNPTAALRSRNALLRSHTAALLGVTIGSMVLIRPLLGIIILPISALLYIENRQKALPSLLRLILFSAVPIAAVASLYFVTGHAALLYDSVVKFNLEVYSKFRGGATYRGSGQMTLVLLVGILLLALVPVHLRLRILFIAFAGLIAPLSTYIQGQGDAHHMFPTYAVMSLLASAGFGFALRRIEGKYIRIALTLFVVLLCVWRGWTRTPTHLLTLFLKTHSLAEVYAAQQSGAISPYVEEHAAEYIRAHTNPGETIQIWGMRSRIYTLAMRRAASRFFTNQHLLMQPHGQPLTPLQLKWRSEFMRSVRQERPAYIIVGTTDNLWMLPGGEASREQLKRFPEFNALLQQSYHPDTTLTAFEIWRRNN